MSVQPFIEKTNERIGIVTSGTNYSSPDSDNRLPANYIPYMRGISGKPSTRYNNKAYGLGRNDNPYKNNYKGKFDSRYPSIWRKPTTINYVRKLDDWETAALSAALGVPWTPTAPGAPQEPSSTPQPAPSPSPAPQPAPQSAAPQSTAPQSAAPESAAPQSAAPDSGPAGEALISDTVYTTHDSLTTSLGTFEIMIKEPESVERRGDSRPFIIDQNQDRYYIGAVPGDDEARIAYFGKNSNSIITSITINTSSQSFLDINKSVNDDNIIKINYRNSYELPVYPQTQEPASEPAPEPEPAPAPELIEIYGPIPITIPGATSDTTADTEPVPQVGGVEENAAEPAAAPATDEAENTANLYIAFKGTNIYFFVEKNGIVMQLIEDEGFFKLRNHFTGEITNTGMEISTSHKDYNKAVLDEAVANGDIPPPLDNQNNQNSISISIINLLNTQAPGIYSTDYILIDDTGINTLNIKYVKFPPEYLTTELAPLSRLFYITDTNGDEYMIGPVGGNDSSTQAYYNINGATEIYNIKDINNMERAVTFQELLDSIPTFTNPTFLNQDEFNIIPLSTITGETTGGKYKNNKNKSRRFRKHFRKTRKSHKE